MERESSGRGVDGDSDSEHDHPRHPRAEAALGTARALSHPSAAVTSGGPLHGAGPSFFDTASMVPAGFRGAQVDPGGGRASHGVVAGTSARSSVAGGSTGGARASDKKSADGAAAGDVHSDKKGGDVEGGETGGGRGGGVGDDKDAHQGKVPVIATPPTVAFASNTIRGATTPAAMSDRITPRKGFSVAVSVTGWTKGQAPVTIEVEGSGGAPGTVSVNGKASLNVKQAAKLKLKGTVQTSPGSAGGLRLVAKQGATVLAASNPFSVAAIPRNYKDTFVSLLTGTTRGFIVQDDWQSDSGKFSDLDETEISELVQVTTATGCFVGLGASNSGYLPGNSKTQDTHSSPTSSLTGVGTRIASQTCMYRDHRTGATDIPMVKSGYLLTRVVTAGKHGAFKFKLTKKGAATTANGITSTAGQGSISKTQDV